MITIVIPTLDVGHHLPATLSALVPGVVSGLVKELVIADGGSRDATLEVAAEAGARVISCAKGRGAQLAAGAAEARGSWLLFLHADTLLETGWEHEVRAFIDQAARSGDVKQAAYFRYALRDGARQARLLEWLVRMRCALLALPYGDQGLLIERGYYNQLGGFKPLPLMEDVDFVRRIPRKHRHQLRCRALTSAERYHRDGYFSRIMRNTGLIVLYHLKVPPRVLARFYE